MTQGSPSSKVREGLADVIRIADQSDPTVWLWDSSNTLGLVCKTTTGTLLGLQIKQAVN